MILASIELRSLLLSLQISKATRICRMGAVAYLRSSAAFHCYHSIAFISAAISQHLHIIASNIDVSELEVDASGLGTGIASPPNK